MKAVAIIKPGSLNAKSKERLTRAGYVVIESDDLECVKIINHVVLPVNDTMIFHAAMGAIGSSTYTEGQFGARLAKAMKEASAPQPSPVTE